MKKIFGYFNYDDDDDAIIHITDFELNYMAQQQYIKHIDRMVWIADELRNNIISNSEANNIISKLSI